MIELLIGIGIGAVAGAGTTAFFKRKKKSTNNGPDYKFKYHHLTSFSNIYWTKGEFRKHLEDLAQSMRNLDDLSLVYVVVKWRRKHSSHDNTEKIMCNLKTLIETTKGWGNVHIIVQAEVKLVEITEPDLDHPHQFTPEELKLIEELLEAEEPRRRIAAMKAARSI